MLPLLHHREMHVAEIAELFRTDEETIRRDLEVAFLCGLPGYTPDLLIDIDLEGEKVSVIDPQVLDIPRYLGAEEVSMLLFGLELVRSLMSISPTTMDAVASLTAKLDSREESADQNPEIIQVEEKFKSVFQEAEKAILTGKDLQFRYVDSNGVVSEREVFPRRIFWRGQKMTLESYDRNRRETRHFFLSSIRSPKILESTTGDEPGRNANSERSRRATLRFSSLPRWWIRRNSAFVIAVREVDVGIEVDIEYWHPSWLVSAVVSVADRFVSIEDPHLTDRDFRSDLLSHISAIQRPTSL